MKFGGTSVADIDKIKNVAKIIANQRETADVSEPSRPKVVISLLYVIP